MMPLEKCAVMPSCEFFGFVGDWTLGQEYIAPAALHKPKIVSDTQMTDINLPGVKRRKETFFIYARDAQQCADDFTCSWYAFRRTVLRPVSIGGKNLQAVERRVLLPITWQIENLDAEGMKDIKWTMHQIADVIPTQVLESHDHPRVLFTSNDRAQRLFSDASRFKSAQPINRFDTKRTLAHLLQKTGAHPFVLKSNGATQIVVPMADDKPARYLLPADFLTALGLHADLDKFPFSVLNNPAEGVTPQEWPDLTPLDLLMVKALYNPAFDKPLPLAEAKKSFKVFHESVRLKKQ